MLFLQVEFSVSLFSQRCAHTFRFRPVVPNHRAADQYQSEGRLVRRKKKYVILFPLYWRSRSVSSFILKNGFPYNNICLFLLPDTYLFQSRYTQKISPQARYNEWKTNVFGELLCEGKRRRPNDEIHKIMSYMKTVIGAKKFGDHWFRHCGFA